MTAEVKFTYDKLEGIADSILKRTARRPRLGIICGTGLGGLADLLKDPDVMEYSSIPGFPVSTVKGHAGKLVFGRLENVECVCMKGRFHFYEGYPIWKTVVPVQVMHLMGVKALIITNAAGGLSQHFEVGDLMLITDHINLLGLTGNNPLRGSNDERFGQRFPPTNNIYNKDLQEVFREAAKDVGLTSIVKSGTYIMQSGPAFETPAELRWFKMMGADAVGMSTVPETVTATHCGMIVLGISMITNVCTSTSTPSAEEVYETANMRAKDLQNIVTLTVRRGQHIWSEEVSRKKSKIT